jgi:DNA-binding FadR family transcriptional regulator
MKFPAIVNERLSDKVVNVITEQIKSGQLKPGDKLPSEPDLANELQVSRGNLREALTTLQARNVIYRKPKEGTFINSSAPEILNESWAISMKQATYLDLIEVRECMEKRIVEKVIDLATDEQINELYDLIKTDASGEMEHSADYYFHYRLAEFSQNIIFANFIDTYYDIFNEITTISSKNTSRKENIYNEHLSIVNAIKARDKKEAKASVRYHLHMVRESLKAREAGQL